MSSTLGTDISTPYYFNLAPNYDYTLTPRLMTKRGVLFENELRYLNPNHRATLVYDLIAKDQAVRRVQGLHSGPVRICIAARDLRPASTTTALRTIDTLSTSRPRLSTRRKRCCHRTAISRTTSRTGTPPSASRRTRCCRIPIIATPVAKPYERVPQATVNGYIADWRGFEAAAALEGTRFQHPTLEPGNRYIADVRTAYPILAPGWFIVPRARVSSTAYDLDPAFHRATTSQTRTLPILSLDTGLIFERDIGWFGRAAQQTLEPRLFYAYIPFRNQDNLPNFDSALADLNYAQLFTENIYSGSDRISEANQLTAALTTRILDSETGAETIARIDRAALLLHRPARHVARRNTAHE